MGGVSRDAKNKKGQAMLYVANWKMLLSYQETLAWCTAHAQELEALAEANDRNQIVICPEALALAPLRAQLNPIIALGAQNCSNYSSGAHTGELSPKSLKELDIKFCLVGHSERRKDQGESIELVAQKAQLLLQNKITPIVCISDAIEHELTPVLEALRKVQNKDPFVIAYEPLSAIGSGQVAHSDAILHALTTIQDLCKDILPDAPASLLYGGSVSAKNIQDLKQIPLLDGFLIGKASTDFAELRQIIELA